MAAPRWLDGQERAAWLGLLGVVVELPQALDRQLRAEAGIGHIYYSILAVLSDSPEGQSRLRDVATRTGTSLSRLSHAIDALEAKGWVTRCRSDDRRGQMGRLTEAGAAVLSRVAPGHVAEVRRLVFDRLTPAEVRQLSAICHKLYPGDRQPGGPGDREVRT
jgi:DNA-binding MarR family transcriptional regulator